MRDFMMLFRSEPDPSFEPSPEELEAEIKAWQEWIAGINEKGHLKHAGEALGFEGKTIHADGTITDGPYVELKEIVGGFIIVTAASIDEAAQLANGCPALTSGGKVEVRDVMQMDGM